jgi:hypothetical protein
MVHTFATFLWCPRGSSRPGPGSVQKWFSLLQTQNGSAAGFYVFYVKQAVQIVSIWFFSGFLVLVGLGGTTDEKRGQKRFVL